MHVKGQSDLACKYILAGEKKLNNYIKHANAWEILNHKKNNINNINTYNGELDEEGKHMDKI